MHVDGCGAEDSRNHFAEKKSRRKLDRNAILKNYHLGQPFDDFVDRVIEHWLRNFFRLVLKLGAWLQYSICWRVNVCVRKYDVASIFHQDQTRGVVRIVFLPKLDKKIEQPFRCPGFFVQNIGAEPKNETECG